MILSRRAIKAGRWDEILQFNLHDTFRSFLRRFSVASCAKLNLIILINGKSFEFDLELRAEVKTETATYSHTVNQ